MIEQNQQQWQSKVEGLAGSIQQVAVTIETLGKDVLKLQETLQKSVRDLTSMVELASRDQVKSREMTQTNLKALDDALSAMAQTQNRLQSQVEAVQNNTESMGREVQEALAKLADELARLSIVERAQIMDNEPSSSSPPSESDGSER